MSIIVCKFGKEDKFNIKDTDFIVDFSNKQEYHYNIFNKKLRTLYKIHNSFHNNALDLFYIALIVYYADRKVLRSATPDSWTRHFKVFIPVLDIDLWNQNKILLEQMVSYLSGDVWEFNFRLREYTDDEKRIFKGIKIAQKKFSEHINSLCMLSGGLDSFIGAIDLLNETKDVIFGQVFFYV